jgi:NAD(P)-dependent dehydrogenase (short-subunit alcohol dehydrogenase family)
MKNVLITGANKSIGFETARQLAKAGYHIYLGSRDKTRGDEAVKKLHAEGLTEVELLLVDVSSEASIQQAAADLAQRTAKLDVLINNAGIPGSFTKQQAASVDEENLRNVFEINFFAPIRMIKAFMPLLQKSDEPRIVDE